MIQSSYSIETIFQIVWTLLAATLFFQAYALYKVNYQEYKLFIWFAIFVGTFFILITFIQFV